MANCPVCKHRLPLRLMLLKQSGLICPVCQTALRIPYVRSAGVGACGGLLYVIAASFYAYIRGALPSLVQLAFLFAVFAVVTELLRHKYVPRFGPDRCRHCGAAYHGETRQCPRCGRSMDDYCSRCGYLLRGLQERRCPECGLALVKLHGSGEIADPA